jgi:hypothetical protein
METEPIKQKIVAETTTLMTLKVDNEELVKHTFKSIRDQVETLLNHAPEKSETYTKAFDIVQAGMNDEYRQFHEFVSYDQKEQALIQLRHKAAEVCELLRAD